MSDIQLVRITRQIAHITIRGTAPLIVHRWSEKAKAMVLEGQQGKKRPKTAKIPEQDYLDSMHRFAGSDRIVQDNRHLDSHGFPTMAFKAATVKGGGRAFGKSVKMTELRQSLVFLPDGSSDDGMQLTRLLIEDGPTMREDMVRIGMGTADIRYRAEYTDWGAVLRIQFMPGLIDLGSIVALVDAGGTNGVGEWRPEKNGAYGTFEVVDEAVS